MATRVIKTETDRKFLYRWIAAQKLPFTLDITKGKRRSVEQNRLQRLWLNEIAEQLGDQTPEEVRGYCKLAFGVSMLCAEDEGFREKYEAAVRPLNYEQRLALMMEPLDMPVTRIMSTDQLTRYLDAISRYYSEQGVRLTDPETFRRAA